MMEYQSTNKSLEKPKTHDKNEKHIIIDYNNIKYHIIPYDILKNKKNMQMYICIYMYTHIYIYTNVNTYIYIYTYM